MVTWGHPLLGGDSSLVQEQLAGVRQIQATERAFAAIRDDGSVVTWGAAGYGGNSSLVQERLVRVQQIQATALNSSCHLAGTHPPAWQKCCLQGAESQGPATRTLS